MAGHRTIDEVLQSTSDSLFPEELGKAEVTMDSVGPNRDTPLHVLIWRGDISGAILLIKNGANVDAVDGMGETPLHAAISANATDVINALLKAGARTDIVSEFGDTVMDKAAKHGVIIETHNHRSEQTP